MATQAFLQEAEKHFPLLEQYTPVLVRVHGDGHPELAEVRDVFAEMNNNVKENGAEKADLSESFTSLRKITNDYDVPADGCETYAATYHMLASLDEAYHAKITNINS